MTTRNLPPVVTLAAVIALTACSGDESGRGTPTPDSTATATATAPPPSTPAQKYLRDANESCAAAREGLDEVPRPPTLQQVPALAAREIEIRQQAIIRLAALDPPPALEDEANQFTSNLQARQTRARAMKRAAEAGNGRRFGEIEAAGLTAHKREAAQARKLGLTECTDI